LAAVFGGRNWRGRRGNEPEPAAAPLMLNLPVVPSRETATWHQVPTGRALAAAML